MTGGLLALLVGLFVVPGVLLWAGHHFRKRSGRVRGLFWGGVTAYGLGSIAAMAAAMYLPAMWSPADAARGFFGYWFLPLVFVIGSAVGAMLGARNDARERAPSPRASRTPRASRPRATDGE
jgi:hypothetical protein